MDKSIHTSAYADFLRILKSSRVAADLTQTQLAERLDENQSTISKYERGEYRLDVIQTMAYCKAIGIKLSEIAAQLELAASVNKL